MKKPIKNNIGVIGQGYVGTAITSVFKLSYDIITYDKFHDAKSTHSSISDLAKESEIIFVCVPTPMKKDGTCDVSIVEEVINEINETSSRKIIVILDGTDPTVFKPGLETKFLEKRHNTNGKYIMLTVGHLEKRKGHDNVIKALSRIRETIPDIVYVIIGRCPMKKDLIELVNDLGLNKNVQFTGFVPYPELPYYYNLCDVFIMPSRNENDDIEGYGLVYVEANSCQKPTIGGDSGGVYDAIIDGQTGLLVNPNDIQDIASKIVYLKNNRNISTQLGIHGRQRVIKELNYDDFQTFFGYTGIDGDFKFLSNGTVERKLSILEIRKDSFKVEKLAKKESF